MLVRNLTVQLPAGTGGMSVKVVGVIGSDDAQWWQVGGDGIWLGRRSLLRNIQVFVSRDLTGEQIRSVPKPQAQAAYYGATFCPQIKQAWGYLKQ